MLLCRHRHVLIDLPPHLLREALQIGSNYRWTAKGWEKFRQKQQARKQTPMHRLDLYSRVNSAIFLRTKQTQLSIKTTTSLRWTNLISRAATRRNFKTRTWAGNLCSGPISSRNKTPRITLPSQNYSLNSKFISSHNSLPTKGPDPSR